MLLAGCGPKTPLTWASPATAPTVEIAVAGELASSEAVGPANVVVRVGPLRDLTPWRNLPMLAMDVDTPVRRHVGRFTGIGRTDVDVPTPYGSLELETEGVAWRVVYLTTRTGTVRQEQSYWLPRAMDAARIVVVVDGRDEELRATVEELSAPLALAVWVEPGRAEVLPNGPFGVFHLGTTAHMDRIRLTGQRIDVITAAGAWTRERLGWSEISP